MKGLNSKPEHFFWALIAAFSGYILIFVYFQISSFKELVPIEKFNNYSKIVDPKDEEIQLNPDQIEVPKNMNNGNLTNVARDLNDKRKKSNDNWSQNENNSKDPAQSAKDFEKQLFEEAGGAKEREKIRREMEERKKNQENNSKKPTNSPNNSSGSSSQYAGNVMVEFKVGNRTAHEGNNWYVRNPGYTCGHGSSGVVVVLISVDKTGKVINARLDEAKCVNASTCMRDQALKYAGISKFNFSDKAPIKEEGYIIYKFAAQ